jgi:hypothetical protein
MLPSEVPVSTGEVQHQLEMAHAQLMQYARDLTRLLEREREKTRELTAERTLLEQTLQGSVKVLTDVLALVSPIAFGRASRLKRYVRHMAQSLGLSEVWQFELAAMLSQVGCVTFPTETLEKMYAGQPLSPEEQQMVAAYPTVGHDLLRHIPRSGAIAAMITHQQDPCGPDTTRHNPRQREAVTLGAQLLKVALDFDRLITHGLSYQQAVTELLTHPHVCDPVMVATLRSLAVDDMEMVAQMVTVHGLCPGMVLAEEIRTKTGVLLIDKGHEVTWVLMERLHRFAQKVGIVEPFRVLVPRQQPWGQ